MTTLSATGTLDPTLCSPHVHRSATTHRHQQTLQSNDRREQLQQEHQQIIMEHANVAMSPPAARLSEIEVGGFASPLTSPILSIADASPLVMQTNTTVQTSPKDAGRTISTNGQVERDNIIGELTELYGCTICEIL